MDDTTLNGKSAKVKAGTPRFCDMVINHGCCLQCRMCDIWRHPADITTLEECKRFVSQLREFVPPPFEINLMGGEPFLVPWVFELCEHIHRCGYISITSTNAYLIDRPMAEKICSCGLDSLAVSLESLNPATHDVLRNKPGLTARVLEAIEFIKEAKAKTGKKTPHLTILSILMEKNYREIIPLVEWVSRTPGIENISLLALQKPVQEWPDEWHLDPRAKELWPQDTEALCGIIDELVRMKRAGRKVNNPVSQLEAFRDYYRQGPETFMRTTKYKAHDYLIDLETEGSVYLSGEPLYNMRQGEASLKDSWYSDGAFKTREKIEKRGAGKRICVINFISVFPKEKGEQDVYEDKRHKGMADFLTEKGEYDAALAEYDAAIASEEDKGRARFGKGVCLFRMRRFPEAAQELALARSLLGDTKDILHHQAMAQRESGRADAAIEPLQRLVELFPAEAMFFHELGFCRLDLGRTGEAQELFTRALALQPSDEYALMGMAQCLLRRGGTGEALAMLRRARRVAPKNLHVRHTLGVIYGDRKKHRLAMIKFREALAIEPGDLRSLLGLARSLRELGQPDEALAALDRAESAGPAGDFAALYRGQCLMDKGDLAGAMTHLARAFSLNPSNEIAFSEFERCCRENGGEAVAAALAQAPEAGEVLRRYFAGRQDEARGMVASILERDPDDRFALAMASRIDRPDFCVIEVTHACMFRCRMCNYWQTSAEGELDCATMEGFVGELRRFAPGKLEMNISGGEPLLKPGITGLLRRIAAENIPFSMATNGYLLRGRMLDEVRGSGLTYLAVSLDSLDPKVHESLRGLPGCHARTMEALEALSRDRGALRNVTIQTIIMGPNLEGLPALAAWADSRGFSISFMAVTRPNMVPVMASWHRDPAMGFLWPQDQKRCQEVLDELVRMKKNGVRIDNHAGQFEKFRLYFSDPDTFVKKTPCSLGDVFLHVNPFGEVHLCCEMDAIGVIGRTGIAAMWNSEKAASIRKQIRACTRNCAAMVNCYRGDTQP